jgi:hypothetical protein|tara:strand:+ start:10458 stop:12308 length:1851 start_codon:yes stop_codon:yes gene_type:complete
MLQKINKLFDNEQSHKNILDYIEYKYMHLRNYSVQIKLLFSAFILLSFYSCRTKKKIENLKNKYQTAFEANDNYSASYQEGIDYYKILANDFDEIQMNTFGMTDSGKPLHEVIISADKNFDPVSLKFQGKTILYINNAIHPGEPCGVDASMMFARDLMIDPIKHKLLDEIVVVIIPYYNISGALNRGSYSRANQDGPEKYGFRGNVRHLDLNRDFIKCDSKNAQSFNQLFNKWKPEVMIDNHTSNGADYQYVMTLIATQKDQLNQYVSAYMTDKMLPELYSGMATKRYEMTPYVYARKTPDEGIAGFFDLPRYSSGYAAIHNTISFMPETHMLKSYKDRVLSTYDFSLTVLEHINRHRSELMLARKKADEDTRTKTIFDIRFALDYDQAEAVTFKGYKAKYKPSAVTGQSRLYYDHNSPYEKEIPFYNTYKSTLQIEKPKAYVFPQAYHKIAERLMWNGVKVERIDTEKTMNVQSYFIENYKDQKAYEGHYLHYDIEISQKPVNLKVYEGDYIVYTDQTSNNYIMATLEPQHPDSFFAWNFTDGILMQKEHFSPYVFEDLAATMLKKDVGLKTAFESKKRSDTEFAENARTQLNWIYERSPYYEEGYKRYPVARIN